jgi:hypothetical protein
MLTKMKFFLTNETTLSRVLAEINYKSNNKKFKKCTELLGI